MSMTPLIGDILMLSQLAWKIGCAFTAGRKGAPAQFAEVEQELQSLAATVTLLADTLHEDDSLLAGSDEKTRDGLTKILGCCSQSLSNLEAFVKQYQEVRKSDEAGGITQRSWKTVLIKNYKTIIWTTEGGNIQSLRNMLALHTQSLSLAMQALQTRSLSRLEGIIEPVANQIENISGKLNGELDVKIDEMHHFMCSLMATINSSPQLLGRQELGMGSSSSLNRLSLKSTSPKLLQQRDSQQPTLQTVYNSSTPDMTSTDVSDSDTSAYSPPMRYRSSTEWSQLAGYSSSTILFPQQISYKPDEPLDDHEPQVGRSHFTKELQLPECSPDSSGSAYHDSSFSPQTFLPPPAITESHFHLSNTPKDFSNLPGSMSKSEETLYKLEPVISRQDREAWEKKLFQHSAVLCDLRGTSIDYTQPDDEIPGDFRMIGLCQPCRICLVRRPEKLASGRTRYHTGIWIMSDDSKVRMQQKVPENEDIIPYTVWGNDTKVVLRVPTELKYYDGSVDLRPIKTVQTAWVSYSFEDEHAATIFQNTLSDRTLVLSVKTRRTMRLHYGITGAFTLAEQLCGLENLRIFYDPRTDINSGLLHFTSSYRDSYLVFPLDNVHEQIRVREESDTIVRIKGLKIPVVSQGRRRSSATEKPSTPNSKSEKIISGAKIEFYTPQDKQAFMTKLVQIQDSFSKYR